MRKKGQTLLITMLVLTIAITVALSLIGRASSDVGMTAQIEESARAFAAAEAGIEKALASSSMSLTGNIISGSIDNDTNTVKYQTEVVPMGNSDGIYTPSTRTLKGDVETVWLVPMTADGSPDITSDKRYTGASLDVCWEDGPAVEVLIVSFQSGQYIEERRAYDSNAERSTNKFTDVVESGAFCQKAAVQKASVALPSGATPIFLRVRPLYGDTVFSFAPQAGFNLPVQGQEIESTGTTGSGVSRKIVVKRQYESIPSVLDYVVYTDSEIIH